jgi:hypothetical protein
MYAPFAQKLRSLRDLREGAAMAGSFVADTRMATQIA